MPRLIAAIGGFDRWKLEGHREMLKRKLTHEQWVSMNTDGPARPLARVRRARGGRSSGPFANVRQEVWEFNVDHWPVLRSIVPTSLVRRIGRRWGWHRIIYGQKA